MKKAIFLLFILINYTLFAQEDFSNIKQQLIQLKTLQEIDDNFYDSAYTIIQNQIIIAENDLKNRPSEIATIEKAIWHSSMADLLFSFYEKNRYQIIQRTHTIDAKNDNFQMWDLTTLVKEMVYHYDRSLDNPSLLQKIPVQNFNEFLKNEKLSVEYRPTLYDLLAHKALDFFSQKIEAIPIPIVPFMLNDPAYFSDNESFIKLNISSSDTLSFQYISLKILQNLTRFHLQSNYPYALTDISLIRINYLFIQSNLPNKEQLYLSFLLDLDKKSENFAGNEDVKYKIGTYYENRGNLYQRGITDEYRWDLKNAVDWYNKTIHTKTNSMAVNNATIKIDNIKRENITFSHENLLLPNNSNLLTCYYKNCEQIYFRIIAIDRKTIEDESFYSSKNYKKLLQYKALHEWSIETTKTEDFQTLSFDMTLPALQPGTYILLATNNGFEEAKLTGITYEILYVSNITSCQRVNNQSIEYILLNRTNGNPFKNQEVTTFYRNYKHKEYDLKKSRTDKNGALTIEQKKDFPYVGVRLNIGKDYFEELVYNFPTTAEDSSIVVYFFTDRAIYRPGQTVYYKGIIVKLSYKNNVLVTDFPVIVSLFDANWQKVEDSKVTTNEYGSFTGSFVLPEGNLSGHFSLNCLISNHEILVEEYKRPLFEIAFAPMKESYKLNEWVEVSGEAVAFAGYAIDNATVKYHIKRVQKLPYWRSNFYYFPKSQEQEIAQGTATTDENGKFLITFFAQDYPLAQNFDPIYNFIISADVTDSNGETQSATTSIPLSKKALFFQHNMPEIIIVDTNESKFTVSTLNINNEKQISNVNCKITQLIPPPYYLHNRLDNQLPDTQFIPLQKLLKTLDYIAIVDNNDMTKWKEKEVVSTFDFETGEENNFSIPALTKLKEGSYKAAFTTKDQYGNEIELIHYFFIQKKQNKKCNIYKPLLLHVSGETVEVGETLSVSVGSYLPTSNALFQVIANDSLIFQEWITLKQEIFNYELPITEKYRGKVTLSALLVDKGRNYVENKIINVPFSNKELAIELINFRKKLRPNATEEWQLKVRDKAGNNISSEVLCSMYDASLDFFKSNDFNFNINYVNLSSSISPFYFNKSQYNFKSYYTYLQLSPRSLQQRYYYSWNFNFSRMLHSYTATMVRGTRYDNLEQISDITPNAALSEDDAIAYKNMEIISETTNEPEEKQPDNLRTNFNETAFFFPQLKTDNDGEAYFSFTMPDALTKWKLQCLAHSKTLQYGYKEEFIQTEKELMLIPNIPRFVREGDTLFLSAKVVNLQDFTQSGSVSLSFLNAETKEKLNLVENSVSQPFTTEKGGSGNVMFQVIIPKGVSSIIYTMSATSNPISNIQNTIFTDAVEGILPVLSSRIPVVEAMAIYVNSGQNKTFVFDKLKKRSISSQPTDYESLTLEFTPNPIWYVVQSLPYITEFLYESNEQLFNHWYANSIATQIANSSPTFKIMFEEWKSKSPNTFLSNLEKNQELKNILLEETPWVVEAQEESDAKRKIANLFDLEKIKNENIRALKKLENNQHYNGAWSWMSDGNENRYITQYIVAGFGHAEQLKIQPTSSELALYNKLLKKAIIFLDKSITTDYQRLQNNPDFNLSDKQISSIQYQYLYARSYFLLEYKLGKGEKEAYNYYLNQAKKYWKETNSIYVQALVALTFSRNNDLVTAKEIMEYIKSRAQYSEEMGMYWKKEGYGNYWHEAQIERQSLLIEAFLTILKDETSVDKMRQWLLKQKQTLAWNSTRATAEACYALLLSQEDAPQSLVTKNSQIMLKIGTEKYYFADSLTVNDTVTLFLEAGTGYLKKRWQNDEISADKATITLSQPGKGVAWGGVYWKYLEEIDNITPSKNNPLTIKKNLYRVAFNERGETLVPISEKNPIKLGDRVRVRIQLQTDRDMEYVHLKDLRASAFEPANVLSQYQYQDGLYYYETTRDVSTNFFFDYLPKGNYVFEYTLIASLIGTYSCGPASVQCLYAPEFTSHSQGSKIVIKK